MSDPNSGTSLSTTSEREGGNQIKLCSRASGPCPSLQEERAGHQGLEKDGGEPGKTRGHRLL